LIASDECDRCNQYFSETIEDHFAKMTGPLRTCTAVSGKRGVPAHKSKDETVRVDFDPATKGFNAIDHGAERTFWHDPMKGELYATFESQPYVPIAVLKCLTKMALAIMPGDELPNYDEARAWILHPDHGFHSHRFKSYKCLYSFVPLPFRQPWTRLLRRKTPEAPLPYMLYLIGTGHALFQIPVPLCARERHLNGQTIVVPKAGHLAFPPNLDGVCTSTIPLGSPDIAQGRSFDMVFKYHSVAEAARPGHDKHPPELSVSDTR
jgi:hypothetical protein